MSAIRPTTSAPRGVPRVVWVRAAIIAGLMALIFWPSLRRLALKTVPVFGTEADWQHAMLVPLVGLYFLYVNRGELLRAPVAPVLPGRPTRRSVTGAVALAVTGVALWLAGPAVSVGLGAALAMAGKGLVAWAALALGLNWGVGSLVFGLLVHAWGIWPGQNDYLKDLGIVVTLFGVVLTLAGWGVMRVAWFPIAFLVCAIPWPGLVYGIVASPLQVLAARAAAMVLSLTGVEAYTTGTKILFERADGTMRELGVAEACAGLKSLMTFVTLAAAVAFLSARPLWQRLTIVASAVPIAVACNVARVAGQGLLDRYVSEELSRDFAHQFVGLVMMAPALVLVLGVGWVLDNLFVEAEDPDLGTSATEARAA